MFNIIYVSKRKQIVSVAAVKLEGKGKSSSSKYRNSERTFTLMTGSEKKNVCLSVCGITDVAFFVMCES